MSIVLKGITWDHPRGYQPLVSCSDIYEKEFGVKIEWHKRSLTAFGDQSLEELCNKFDLLVNDHPHVGLAVEKNCLEPLDNIISTEDLSRLQLQSAGPSFLSYCYKEKQWALPIDAAMQSATFRPDLISQNNIPSDWDEVFKLADSLKKVGSCLGMALSPTDCLCSFLSLAAQSNAPIREEQPEFIKKDIGLHVLGMLKKMRKSFHPGALHWTPIDLFDYMALNDDVIYCPLAFCYNNYSRIGFRRKRLIFHNAPGINNAVLGGAGISVSSACKNKTVAGTYLSWICSAEIQKTTYADNQG